VASLLPANHLTASDDTTMTMKAIVLDGYADEPSCLGVPPFISTYARMAYGAIEEAGADVSYVTIDQWRAGGVDLKRFDLLMAIRHVAVPGKYLRGMPASDRELAAIGRGFAGRSIVSLGARCGPAPGAVADSYDYLAVGDPDAFAHDIIDSRTMSDRRRTQEEWASWLLRGAKACESHPDHGGPLIAEMQMYRGCVRHFSGGCSFCIEPLQGGVAFREPRDILDEAVALAQAGVRHIRLGAQTCAYSYLAEGVGETETPRPNPEAVGKLLEAISEQARPKVFHLDNANPAVIAAHPREARKITKAIAEHCTGGNVVAFGLESADPLVAKANNLNADAETTLEAIRIVNELGRERSETGLPRLLPGINFICGLEGETKATYAANMDFLRRVASEGLLLRRVNIRQVIPSRREFEGVRLKREFAGFKKAVREHIDLPMLDELAPDGTVLRDVYTELREGGRTFGRQAGSYPILIGLPYPFEIGRWIDVSVTGRGPRSIIAIQHPTDPNTATLGMLEAVPGIGKRRAMAIVRNRPFANDGELWRLLGEDARTARRHLTTGREGQE
jgi:radical SAM superfamily enzyme with C-terminal helix-hairpin-helix motif